MEVPSVQTILVRTVMPVKTVQGATRFRRSTAAKRAGLAWTTIVSTARGGKHTAERAHLPQCGCRTASKRMQPQGLTRQFLKCSRQRSSSRQHSTMRVKQTSIGVNKIDSHIVGSKQENCDEISNEMKSMLIKICWTKDVIEQNIQNLQELLLDTKHVPKQCSEITLSLFGRPPRDIDKTTLQQPQKKLALCLDATLGIKAHGREGPGKDNHGTPMPAREGRGWPTTRSTMRQTCTTKKQTQLS